MWSGKALCERKVMLEIAILDSFRQGTLWRQEGLPGRRILERAFGTLLHRNSRLRNSGCIWLSVGGGRGIRNFWAPTRTQIFIRSLEYVMIWFSHSSVQNKEVIVKTLKWCHLASFFQHSVWIPPSKYVSNLSTSFHLDCSHPSPKPPSLMTWATVLALL